MRKSLFLFVLLILIGLGAFLFVTPTGLSVGAYRFAFNRDKQIVSDLTGQFLEDLKFKDFQKAATYHTPEEQSTADIPRLIEEKFAVKPEFLDIRRYEIAEVEVDSTGQRARVKTTTNFKVLNTKEIRDADIIFYWKKIGGRWYMQLRSSLERGGSVPL